MSTVIASICAVVSSLRSLTSILLLLSRSRSGLTFALHSYADGDAPDTVEWMLYVTCVGPGEMFALEVSTDRMPDGLLVASVLHPGDRRLMGGIRLSAPPTRGMKAEDAARASMGRIMFSWRTVSGLRKRMVLRLGDVVGEKGVPLDAYGRPLLPWNEGNR